MFLLLTLSMYLFVGFVSIVDSLTNAEEHWETLIKRVMLVNKCVNFRKHQIQSLSKICLF